jgi:hypothetical protein
MVTKFGGKIQPFGVDALRAVVQFKNLLEGYNQKLILIRSLLTVRRRSQESFGVELR